MTTPPSTDPPQPAPVTEEFEARYLNDLVDEIQRDKGLANRPMIYFVIIRLGLVVASASLPALTAWQVSWFPVVAILVAVLAGIDTQFRWGDEWQHFRSAQLAFDRLRREYERRKAIQVGCAEPERARRYAADFDWLFNTVEALAQSEADRFWKFRIVEWRASGKTT